MNSLYTIVETDATLNFVVLIQLMIQKLPVSKAVSPNIKSLLHKFAYAVHVLLIHLLNSVFSNISLTKAVMRTLKHGDGAL